MILAGAVGNIIDCLFYGEIFSSSYGKVAQFVQWGEGYGSLFEGRVVDMFYFPLFTWPEWMPLVGGDIFFGPVFNFADACISCSVVAIILFYRRYVVN
jgi:signal peptidase II